LAHFTFPLTGQTILKLLEYDVFSNAMFIELVLLLELATVTRTLCCKAEILREHFPRDVLTRILARKLLSWNLSLAFVQLYILVFIVK